jgi:hypothetical protein
MKKYFFIIALLFGQKLIAQTSLKIDTSNYYKYISPKNLKSQRLTTNWLRLDDVVPIMKEEFKEAGYEWIYDRTIYKLKDSQYINLSAYCRKNNIGFLYIEGHEMFPTKDHRKTLFQKDNSKINYVECVETYNGQAEFVKIKEIPKNIFLLREDCYFFQYTDNIEDNNSLVTKEIAIEILRQDLRKYLSTAEKPKK